MQNNYCRFHLLNNQGLNLGSIASSSEVISKFACTWAFYANPKIISQF